MDEELERLLEGDNKRFSLESFVNQFLFQYVEDENFDDAKEEMTYLFKIVRENPNEEIKF